MARVLLYIKRIAKKGIYTTEVEAEEQEIEKTELELLRLNLSR